MTWVGASERRCFFRLAAAGLMLGIGILSPGVSRSETPLFLGITTSTENSGLLAHLIDAFEADHDVKIRAVTSGSGAILNLAARGDVDVVLVHSPADEKAFTAEGYGIDRRPVMRNRFVIVGPKADPAGIRSARDAVEAFTAIARSGALFLSRGDESGTHKAEHRLWQRAGIDPTADGGDWYRESGSGQGATLNITVNFGAYTLTDEATWATFGNPGDLETLFDDRGPRTETAPDQAGDPGLDSGLDNVYSVIRVNPERHPGINAEDALVFADWLTSKAGQAAIASFTAGGRTLFQPMSRLAG